MTSHNIVVLIADRSVTEHRCLNSNQFPKEIELDRLIVRCPDQIRGPTQALTAIGKTLTKSWRQRHLSKVIWFQAHGSNRELADLRDSDDDLLQQVLQALSTLENKFKVPLHYAFDGSGNRVPMIKFDPKTLVPIKLKEMLLKHLSVLPSVEDMADDTEYYTKYEVEVITGLTRRAVDKALKDGRLAAVRKDNEIFILGSNVYDWQVAP